MSTPPVILFDADIEHLQQLGSRGVPIVAVVRQAGFPTTASRWVTETDVWPRFGTEGFDDWFGSVLDRHPGAVLIPDSDDFSWYLDDWRGRHGDGRWRFAVPPRKALHTALAKGRLHVACEEAGLRAPRTWLAPSEDAAMDGLGEARFPVIVKPQSRVGNSHWGRGQLARDEAGLREAVRWALANIRFRPEVANSIPGIEVPMVQESIGGRDRPVYHLCGYVSAAGQSAVLAHRKLLQVPRRFGSGICFETAEVDQDLAARLFRLLENIGFHGMFEAEFLSRGGEHLLIDLNVRPYNGMRLEAERGLEAAWYLYLEAMGEHEQLARELEKAAALSPAPGLVYCRKMEFAAMVAGQFAGGGFGARDAGRWAAWYWRNRKRMVDPWEAPGDPAAGRARLRYQARTWVKSPRQFLGVYLRRESSR